jgi:hypothetical protein
MNGIMLRLPLLGEAFIELRSEWVGFGATKVGQDTEVYLGLLQIAHSKTRLGPANSRSTRKLLVAALAVCLLVPSPIHPMANAVGIAWDAQHLPWNGHLHNLR